MKTSSLVVSLTFESKIPLSYFFNNRVQINTKGFSCSAFFITMTDFVLSTFRRKFATLLMTTDLNSSYDNSTSNRPYPNRLIFLNRDNVMSANKHN